MNPLMEGLRKEAAYLADAKARWGHWSRAVDFRLPKLAALWKVERIVWAKEWRFLDQLPRLEAAIASLDRADIDRVFERDPWARNFFLSLWEYAKGVDTLESYPWNITVPVADVCNARCTFCTSWLEGRRVLDLRDIERLAEVVRRAFLVGLVGHGEPLAHPEFPEVCGRIGKLLDPRASCYLITNGLLLEKWRAELDQLRIGSYSISLNAASSRVHHQVMGLGEDAFDQIIESIRYLIHYKKMVRDIDIYITLVVTQQNLGEVAKFVELGNSLKVRGIWLRSLLPQPDLVPGLNYHELPPTLHPDFEKLRQEAVQAIARSVVPVQAEPSVWSTALFPPPLALRLKNHPPRLVTRAEAQRDIALRERTGHLYRQPQGALRGQVKSNGAGTVLTWRSGVAEVETALAQWAYAVSLPFDVTGPEESGLAEVDIEVPKGEVSVGLLNAAGNDWLDRAFVSGAKKVQLRWQGSPPSRLVVDNASPDGPSHARVLRVSFLPEGAEAPQECDLATLNVHNRTDPFDDGLNPLGRQPRFACKAVYYNLYVNEMFFRVNPCCYMQNVPGHEETWLTDGTPFHDLWNSSAFVSLRQRLRDGPLYGACQRCPEKW